MGTLWCLFKLTRVLGGFLQSQRSQRCGSSAVHFFSLQEGFYVSLKRGGVVQDTLGLGVFVLCLKCSESLLCFPTRLAFFVCVSLAVTECCYNEIRPGLFIAASQVSVNMFSDCRHLLKYASCRQALLPSPLLQNERIKK